MSISRPPRFSRRPSQASRPVTSASARRTSWEGVSDWYADYLAKPGTIQAEVVFPKTFNLLGLRRGQSFLDIACGEGSFSRLVQMKADARVFGIDASHSLIQIAQRQARNGASYYTSDAMAFSMRFQPAQFDAASCILAIQNIEQPERVFAELARVLKPSGTFVLVMNHPYYRQPKQSEWGWDQERKIQYRRVDRYLSAYEVPIIAHPGAAPSVRTFSFHRPLSWYVEALSRAGFVIDGMEEWVSHKTSDSGPRAKAENIAREEIPMFLALRAKKR